VVAIAQKDFRGIVILAERFGNCEPKKVEMLVNLVENLRTLSPSSKDKDKDAGSLALATAAKGGPENESQIEQVLSELSYMDLFEMFDKDHSGDINFEEFLDLTKYLKLNLTDHQSMKIFSQSAKGDGLLDKDNFEHAMNLLRNKISSKALNMLGLSTGELMKILLVHVIILFFMFGFIFLGIAAFTNGTTFSTIINSLLPIVSALGLGMTTGAPASTQEKDENKDTVKKVFENIKKAT